ncbi:MAG TPA: phosphohistidine phosphatase SixA [Gemmatimonadaceae bacterium]|nr:phosphohistidine phosphatase SixA [Gemmatimonadaceae bacterium]
MELLVIRHAIAGDREEWAKSGQSDDLRPVTAEGARKMRRGAAGLASVHPTLDVLAASPLLRAAQTAAIVARAYDGITVETVESLAPSGKRSAVLHWLRGRGDASTVAIVGHEPSLGQLATWLLTGVVDSRIELKKGAACLIRFDRKPAAGGGMLVWSLSPAQLRQLGRRA